MFSHHVLYYCVKYFYEVQDKMGRVGFLNMTLLPEVTETGKTVGTMYSIKLGFCVDCTGYMRDV